MTGVAVDQKIARQCFPPQQHAVDHTFAANQTDTNAFGAAHHHEGGFDKQTLLPFSRAAAHNLAVRDRRFQLPEAFLIAT